MNRLDRYIIRVLLSSTLLVLLVLLALNVFFALVGELDSAGQGNYSYVDIFIYVACSLPRMTYEIFPAAVLIGGLLGLGNLAAQQELTAMRAAGVSVLRIAGAAVQAGLLMIVFSVFVGEVLMPFSAEYAQKMRLSEQNKQVSAGRSGVWMRDGNRFVNVRVIHNDGLLEFVSVMEFDDQSKLHRMLNAHKAQTNKNNNTWVFSGVTQTRFVGDRVEKTSLDTFEYVDFINPDFLRVASLDPRYMSALALWRYVQYQETNHLDSGRYRLAFWLKWALPFSVLAMLLMALPFAFGSTRSGNAGRLLLLGVLVGLSFYILMQMTAHLAQIYNMSPFWSAFGPVGLVLGIALWRLRTVR
ncbi:MAG: LPS export ABC transporter permease LptG [Gammaproteobacteria bacterium]|nr:LPS export ABC transporter permease LptG [Gammaproteobacteria bacterium]